jgi:hypothetical protein
VCFQKEFPFSFISKKLNFLSFLVFAWWNDDTFFRAVQWRHKRAALWAFVVTIRAPHICPSSAADALELPRENRDALMLRVSREAAWAGPV